jgi:hypothetical protein
LSPELDDFPSKDTASKHFDTRERCNIKNENIENGLPRKMGACKASSKRYPDTSQKANLANSKSNKEVLYSTLCISINTCVYVIDFF